MKSISNGSMPTVPDTVVPFVKDIIERCWDRNPESRPTVDEIFAILCKNDFKVFPHVDSLVIKKDLREWTKRTGGSVLRW
jgi:hypothetical protein